MTTEDLRSLTNWAKELGLPEKKLKEAVKAADLQPDSKRGICCFYSREKVEAVAKTLKG
ncbi:MAG: hypothetical protein H6Q00_1880 [Holophagaceae bacterium]|nr:hypothetical protein [Holophagaceae bacterium]